MKLPTGSGLFKADLKSYMNYYPFGIQQFKRSWDGGTYHYRSYGYNGKETDNDIYGTGNSYDYGARIYDPRVGRWMTRDPFEQKYSALSPYHFAANTPIWAKDPDGKRIYFVGGAGLDTKGWKYTERWGKAFENNGIKDFFPLRDVSHDKPGSFPQGDISFTGLKY